MFVCMFVCLFVCLYPMLKVPAGPIVVEIFAHSPCDPENVI